MLSLIGSIIYHCNSFQRRISWNCCRWHTALCRRFQSEVLVLVTVLSGEVLTPVSIVPMGTLNPVVAASFKVTMAWDPGRSQTKSF